jgi:hypothetical protein
MKRSAVSFAGACVLLLCLTSFSGCGSSSSSIQTPPASITSFTASTATITTGASITLTGVFANGTGVITPGNLSVSSGLAVSVTPTATTTYTLTVTPSSGAAATATATVTVDPMPTIASFVAGSTTINGGASTTLTGVFANGAGVITPGNISATSGTAVTVTPAATTDYTLTVANTANASVTAAVIVTVKVIGAPSTVTVDLSSSGPPVTDQLLGMNGGAWFDMTSNANEPGIINAFQAAGIKAVRWPGGSFSDDYNWENNTECGGYADPADDFTDYVNDFVKPAGVDLAVTADYGTGLNCSGPGDPTEAAAWAAEAVKLGATISHMTVGNEEYGNWETDNHPIKNDPTTYANAVAGANGYYALIKASSPATLVGVDVDADVAWDSIVLANAPYDFVEFHYYPEAPGSESDTYITQHGAQDLTTDINDLKTELASAGKPNTPIYVGEIGGPYSNPGKQSWSITQGLYAGQVLGEMMNAGVSRLTWWIGFGNCNGQSGNDTASVYGWQDFGAYNVFSDGPTEDPTCPGAGPFGAMSPTARAFQLFSNIAVNGESALTAAVAGDTTDVRAYAATNNGGTALFLVNTNETTTEPVTITLTGKSSTSAVTVITYDKALYDLSGSPSGTPPDPSGTSTWASPTTTTLGAQSLPLTLSLTPWSMNVVILK